MATITEDYVSFETAKLLVRKGFNFNAEYESYYTLKGVIVYFKDKTQDINIAPRITLQMAMKWLREVYHIEINITFGFPFINGKQQYKYFWSIVRVCDNHLEYPMDDPNSAFYNEEMADSFEESVESAIKYCLENLI